MGEIISELRASIEQAGLVEKLTTPHILTCMLTALFCGLVIYTVYRTFFRGIVYSESFNVLNVMTCLTVSFLIMTISANLILSLGVIGSLSIVRFRTAIKDPVDMGFLFMSIASGLTSGAGMYPLAIIGTLFIAAVYVLMTFLGGGRKVFLLVVKYKDEAAAPVMEAAKKLKAKMKSCVTYQEYTELTVSIKYKGIDTSIVDGLKKIDGVNNAVIMEYSGD
jgi:uncharacterized membrane protein YhiD involved in acid resistance